MVESSTFLQRHDRVINILCLLEFGTPDFVKAHFRVNKLRVSQTRMGGQTDAWITWMQLSGCNKGNQLTLAYLFT